jgi:hypothetical protein
VDGGARFNHTTLNNMSTIKNNYRIYDRTGGGVTHDIYATNLDDAIEQGRAWIEDGDWSSEDGDWSSEDGTYRTRTLECCVRRTQYRLDIAKLREIPGVLAADVNPAGQVVLTCSTDYQDASGLVGAFVAGSTVDDEGCWDMVFEALPDTPKEIDEAATSMEFGHDCSGSYSDELPECEADEDSVASTPEERDEALHVWKSPYQLVGGIEDNPGVWSNGGACYTFRAVCAVCGKYKYEVDKGSQCHASESRIIITLEDADDASKEWLKELHETNGYLPAWLAEYLDCEEETLTRMQEAVSDLQTEAQDISHGIWQQIEDADLGSMGRTEACEWLSGLQERLEEAKAHGITAPKG